ncbi:MAG: 1-(5-phosphoribosyl)-5-((5-phosphoribosylamino)methylideneamino)imidazole-4-carboxamide isomerase, partial [Clostridia bacterium]|nr:1-(5-phosphoribosyl)-5-((5-phosphoribosylamino)methylideneamino)imidazole-4-carboxamide isomerase [Clostridia bacterium]
MQLYPAIDLYDKKAVRLFKGDYSKMTVYSNDPLSVALDFESKGAKYIHLVDLEGAKDGTTPNLEVVKSIAQNTNLFVEIGGGIRDMQR